MTEEEIDKMADNFVNTQDFTRVYSVARKAECGAFWKYGFLAGLKAGKDTNVPTKWHDLRKAPNDLPKENEYIMIYSKLADNIAVGKRRCAGKIRKRCVYEWYFATYEGTYCLKDKDIIAWKEIELPKEIKENE